MAGRWYNSFVIAKTFAAVFILCILGALAYAAWMWLPRAAPSAPHAPVPAASPVSSATSSIPELSPRVVAKLHASKGFQTLVSYTDDGFEPTDISVAQGSGIRFVNNSSEALTIASDPSAPYPGKSPCATSAFNSCETLQPGDFWEFTFDINGSWSFRNELDPAKVGTLNVTVHK